MVKIFKYLKPKEWMKAGISLIFIVMQVWLELKMPDYMSEITMLVQTPGSEMKDIWIAGGYMLLCALGSLAGAVIVGYYAAQIAASFSQRLRSMLFNKVESFSMEEINRFSTSSLITRSTNDITQIQMLVTLGLQLVIKAPIMAVWAVTKISGKGFEWTAVTGAAVIILIFMVSLLMIFVIPKFKKMQTLTDNITRVTRENLTGLRVVRAYNAEDYQEDNFETANKELTGTQLFTNRVMVMEGKSVLFKEFGDVNAFPICLDTQDTEEIIKTIVHIAPAFGGINLEDISAPRCFEIEERLKSLLNIPVFHDDQHGTAIVVLAAIINALKVTGKEKESCKVVINGAGSAGIAITKLLLTYGFQYITLCDSKGIISKDISGLNSVKQEIAQITNHDNKQGTLADALSGSDIFIGVSAAGAVTEDMVRTMNKDAIIFAMANPVPEIYPEDAKAGGARVVGTGRSDFPNQINNVIAFPGIFKGALEGRAKQITEEMKLAAAIAIAGVIPDNELNEDYIIPDIFNPVVKDVVAKAVIDNIKERIFD